MLNHADCRSFENLSFDYYNLPPGYYNLHWIIAVYNVIITFIHQVKNLMFFNWNEENFNKVAIYVTPVLSPIIFIFKS